MRRTIPEHAFLGLASMILTMAACGSSNGKPAPSDAGAADGGPDAIPDAHQRGVPIVGGGFSGGPVAGIVDVFVLDDSTDQPIAEAFVQVGEDAATARAGTTDAQGFLSVADPALTGAQTLTAGKSGYRTSTITDLDASSVTFSLRPLSAPAGTGQVDGIVDFSALPALPSNHHYAAFALAQLDDNVEAISNLLGQAMPGIENVYGPDLPFLMKSQFTITVPAGLVGLYAIVADVDTSDPDYSKWAFTLTHLGVLDGLTLGKNEEKPDAVIPVVAPIDQKLAVSIPDLPGDMPDGLVAAVVERPSGRLLALYDPSGAAVAGVPVPKLEGALAGTTLWGVAVASNSSTASQDVPLRLSLSVVRGIASLEAPVLPPAFLDAIGDPQWANGEISYAPVADASLHVFTIAGAGGDPAWDITVLDGQRTAVKLPETPTGADLETVPGGDLDLTGQARRLPGFQPGQASFRELAKAISGLSTISFRSAQGSK